MGVDNDLWKVHPILAEKIVGLAKTLSNQGFVLEIEEGLRPKVPGGDSLFTYGLAVRFKPITNVAWAIRRIKESIDKYDLIMLKDIWEVSLIPEEDLKYVQQFQKGKKGLGKLYAITDIRNIYQSRERQPSTSIH